VVREASASRFRSADRALGEQSMPRLIPILLLVAGTGWSAGAGDDPKPRSVRVVIESDKGDIEVELDVARAPKTTANFLKYVDGGHYNGGRFHRTVTPDNQPKNKVKIEVIQAGTNLKKAKDDFKPIALERTRDTKLKHLNGTISMARDEPDTATSDFFICIGNQPELDFGGKRNPDGQGFAAFGKVVKGMEVVQAIQKAPADGQTLKPPIRIVKISRVPEKK
jgi:peptidyl-prolyl cis-trans isomerase A (cyclophilin A)